MRFAALSPLLYVVLTGLALLAPHSHAALTYSGVQNITIPSDFDGIYVTFTDVNDAESFTTSTTDTGSWHFNPYFVGASVATSDLLRPVTASITTNSNIVNLAYGTVIDAASTTPTGNSGSTGHMGTGTGQFQNGVMGYMGFAITFGTNVHYGYARVTFRNDGTAGTIHDWAWDTTPSFAATAVPEPATVIPLSLALSLFAAVHLRRRRAKRAS